MKSQSLVVGLIAGISLPAFAQTLPMADEVVVTATRFPQPFNQALADVTVISPEQLRAMPGQTLVELLQSVAGLEVTRNGPPGAPAGVFIRGTETRHTVLMIDGVRVGSATAGTLALEAIPLEQIERVEILRGAASSFYGADAIGGVIQIFTRRGQGPARLQLEAGVGSDRLQRLQAGLTGGTEQLRYALSLGKTSSDAFSALHNPSDFAYNADRDGYDRRQFAGRLEWQINADHTLNFAATEGRVDNHYDGSYPDLPSYDFRARQRIASRALTSRNQWLPGWRSELTLGESIDRYDDYGSTAVSRFETRQTQLSWMNRVDLPLGALDAAVEQLRQTVAGTTAYTVTERDITGVLLGWSGQVGAHSWRAHWRRDRNSQFGTENTGGVAWGYAFTPQWQVNASHATAFRAPSFNLLYYPGFGNPNLRPERAKNSEISLQFREGVHSAAATFYHNRLRDYIGDKAVNVETARIQGLTLSGSTMLDCWRLAGSIDWADPRDQINQRVLSRRARQHASVSAERAWSDWSVRLEGVASGARREYPFGTPPADLSGYVLVNAVLSRDVAADTKLVLRLDNVFDQAYELAKGYGTAGRTVYLGVQYQPKL